MERESETSETTKFVPKIQQLYGVTIKQEIFDGFEDGHIFEMDDIKVKNEPVFESTSFDETPDFGEEGELITPDFHQNIVPTTHKPSALCCSFCPAKVTNLRLHLKNHHPVTIANPEKILQCRYCENYFKSKDLVAHCRQSHQITGALVALTKVATKRTPNKQRQLLRERMMAKNHLKALQNSCPICKDDTRTKINDLRVHLQIFHENLLNQPNESLICVLCSLNFSAKDLDTHTSSKKCLSRRVCYHCGKSFFKWIKLQTHLQATHHVFCCNICDVICGSKTMFNKHNKFNLHLKEGKIPERIKSYLNTKKAQIRKNLCPLCPIGTNVSHLKFHLRLVHGDFMKNPDDTKECMMCEEAIQSKDVPDHATTCNGIKDLETRDLLTYSCQHCQLIFVNAQEFTKHITAHSFSRSYRFIVPP